MDAAAARAWCARNDCTLRPDGSLYVERMRSGDPEVLPPEYVPLVVGLGMARRQIAGMCHGEFKLALGKIGRESIELVLSIAERATVIGRVPHVEVWLDVGEDPADARDYVADFHLQVYEHGDPDVGRLDAIVATFGGRDGGPALRRALLGELGELGASMPVVVALTHAATCNAVLQHDELEWRHHRVVVASGVDAAALRWPSSADALAYWRVRALADGRVLLCYAFDEEQR